jgi:hypothetical protein
VSKNIDVFCPIIDDADNIISSDASASITWTDHNKFDIHLVAETLFDTEKIHLTEKVFKPIVMYHSFIFFAGAHSLKYIRDYGFRTFGDIWDESYDDELDTKKRFSKILALIDSIDNLSKPDYYKLIKRTEEIIHHNRNHFYSDRFKNQLISELTVGLDEAIEIQRESFYSSPGGTLFHYCNLYNRTTHRDEFKKSILPALINAFDYANSKSKMVGRDIIKKYNHLLTM